MIIIFFFFSVKYGWLNMERLIDYLSPNSNQLTVNRETGATILNSF